jgi:hypothetical protein
MIAFKLKRPPAFEWLEDKVKYGGITTNSFLHTSVFRLIKGFVK